MTDRAHPWNHYWFSAIFWFLAAVLVRALYLSDEMATSPLFYAPLLDEKEAIDQAQLLLSTYSFGPEPLFKAPAYAAFLAMIVALFGNAWPLGIRAAQHLLGAILIFPAFDLGWRLSRRGPAGKIAAHCAAAITAFYTPMLRLESCVVLDGLVAVTAAWFLWFSCRLVLSIRGKFVWLFVLGASVTGATTFLLRPTILPVLPLVAVVLYMLRPAAASRSRAAVPIILLAPTVLAAASLMLRNYVASGEPLFLPWQGGYNLYQANRAEANGRYLSQSQFDSSLQSNPTRSLMVQEYLKSRGGETAASVRYGDVDRFWRNRTVGEISSHPLRWLQLMSKKFLYLASDKEIYNFEEFDLQKERSPVLKYLPLSFGVIFPLALAGLPLLGQAARPQRRLILLIWIYTLGWVFSIALYFASGRMRMPLAFPCMILASFTVGGFLSHRFSRNSKMIAAAFFIVGLAASWGDWWGVRSENMRHADYARMSNGAWASGKYTDALDYADKAYQLSPNYPTISLLRAQALYGLNRISEAKQLFEKSITQLPADPVAPNNLGIILYYNELNTTGALKAFNEAASRSPQYHSAVWRSALCHIALRDTTAAAQLLEPYSSQPRNQGEAAKNSDRGTPLLLRVAQFALACAQQVPKPALLYFHEKEIQQVQEELTRLNLSECSKSLTVQTKTVSPLR